MKRLILIETDDHNDNGETHGYLAAANAIGGDVRQISRTVRLPWDHQLTHDLKRLLNVATSYAIWKHQPGDPGRQEIHDAIGRLRAAAGLGDDTA